MNNDIFLPERIKVGYTERNDTYTKRLGYIIYYDQTGKLRKEKSWENWRDKKIEAQEFNNEPTEGFVLNKKAGGDRYGWNPRQTYVRVYDPRGFEFEITIPNLLYILENTNSIIGKGLEGEFVYGWSGAELLLMPTCTKEYEDMMEFKKAMYQPEEITAKDLVVGMTYLNKRNIEYVYLGKYELYEDYRKPKGKVFYFWNKNYNNFETMKSVNKKFIKVLSMAGSRDIDGYMDKVQRNEKFSPVDLEATKQIPYTKDEFLKVLSNKEKEYQQQYPEHFKKYGWNLDFYYFNENIKTKFYMIYHDYSFLRFKAKIDDEKSAIVINGSLYQMYLENNIISMDKLFEKHKPHKIYVYLKNGVLYKTYE